jgi:hypothetical protein
LYLYLESLLQDYPQGNQSEHSTHQDRAVRFVCGTKRLGSSHKTNLNFHHPRRIRAVFQKLAWRPRKPAELARLSSILAKRTIFAGYNLVFLALVLLLLNSTGEVERDN